MTNRPTQGRQPTGAGATERSCKDASTHNGRASGDHASGPSLLVVAAIVVALLLAAAPAWAQESEAPGPEETPEATGMEAGDGPPGDDGSVETSDGDRSLQVGDGCVLIEREGGEDLAVGSCDEADDARGRSGGGDTADESRPDEERTTPQDTTERTITEGTTPEETAPAGANDFEESTASEGTAPEETGSADGGGADAECPTAPVGETFEATVERAVDGDTLELAQPVEDLSRVRLIGVDAPETEGEGGEPEPHAEEAVGFTASELEGERVLLELDEETTDPDRRLLAHVWREQESSRLERWLPGGDESELFNLTLLEGGYATAMPVEPNTRYAVCFDDAERVAREEGSGLWGAGGPDDEQYEEATDPESSAPELTTPEAEEPEQTLSEETNPGGPAEEEAPTGFDSPPVTDDRPEQTSPETTEPTGRTTPVLPENNGEETIEAPQDRYGEPEERTVPEGAPAGEPASEEPLMPTDGDTFGLDAETGPVQEATVSEERTISEPSNETSEETTGTRYDQYGEPEERAVLEIAREGAPARESSIPAASEGESGYDAEAGPVSAATPTVAPLPALPTRQTPEGPVQVLPATGGASFLPLILGAVVLTAGVLSLGLLRRGDRRRGVRSDEW